MVRIAATEDEVAENVTEYNLDSVQGMILELMSIARDPKSKPTERMRALNQIAELRGYKVDRTTKNLRNLSFDELHGAIREIVVPMLAPFGLKGSQKDLILDADKTDP